jgi:uncharacterized protein
MLRVSHFELPADDPSRCMQFYQSVLGWTFTKWDGPMEYWLIKTGDGPGIDGGLGRRRQPGEPPTNVVDVASLDDALSAVKQAGGNEVVPKMAVPGVGWVAYVTDTEGNVFGLIQHDPAAK